MNRYIIYVNAQQWGATEAQKLINCGDFSNLTQLIKNNKINIYWLDKGERLSEALKQLDYYQYRIYKTNKYII